MPKHNLRWFSVCIVASLLVGCGGGWSLDRDLLPFPLSPGTTSSQSGVSSYAGTGTTGANDGERTQATFAVPYDLAVDCNGVVYVADKGNHKIRKIVNGVVSTLAGSGMAGATDAVGVAASFNSPSGVYADCSGKVYVADSGNNKIRLVLSSGEVSTLAGSGVAGAEDGAAASASFRSPTRLLVLNGVVYLTDSLNHKIRSINLTTNNVATFAGSGVAGSNNASGIAATFNQPTGIAADSAGNLYVADTYNQLIRKLTSDASVSTLAGSGASGNQDGTGSNASFSLPTGIAVDGSGNLLVSDSLNQAIRMVTAAGVVTSLAGTNLPGAVDGDYAKASFNSPNAVAINSSGDYYIADTNNNKIRLVKRR